MKKTLKAGDDGDLNVYSTSGRRFPRLGLLPDRSPETNQSYLDGIVLDWETLPGASDRYAGAFDLGETADARGRSLAEPRTHFRRSAARSRATSWTTRPPRLRRPPAARRAGLLPGARPRPHPQLHGLLVRQLLHGVHAWPDPARARRVAPVQGLVTLSVSCSRAGAFVAHYKFVISDQGPCRAGPLPVAADRLTRRGWIGREQARQRPLCREVKAMKHRFVLASLAVVALLAVACGGGGATTAPTTAPATSAPACSDDRLRDRRHRPACGHRAGRHPCRRRRPNALRLHARRGDRRADLLRGLRRQLAAAHLEWRDYRRRRAGRQQLHDRAAYG